MYIFFVDYKGSQQKKTRVKNQTGVANQGYLYYLIGCVSMIVFFNDI